MDMAAARKVHSLVAGADRAQADRAALRPLPGPQPQRSEQWAEQRNHEATVRALKFLLVTSRLRTCETSSKLAQTANMPELK
jgi:hypothetical protein